MPDLAPGDAIPDPDVMSVPWFAVPNDAMACWALATVDVPVSEVFNGAGRLVVGEFMAEEVARRVADLHNADLAVREALAVDGVVDDPAAIRLRAVEIAEALIAHERERTGGAS